MKIELINNSGFKWYTDGNIWVKGYFFDRHNNHFSNEKMLNFFSESIDIQNSIRQINGCFALVFKNDDKIFLVADKVRSIPLFYSIESGEIRIRDHLDYAGENADFNHLAISEFLMCGYTIGDSTLLNRFKQVQAGEMVAINFDGTASSLFYYNHYHDGFLALSEEEHFAHLEKVTERFIKRLILSADNRPIVVPLSGGYDSRYIVAGLRKYAYENVICFTYGGKNSPEVATAKKVAERLGYTHHIIDYTDEKLVKLMETEDFISFNSFAFNYAALPHIQDYLALTELRENKQIPDNAIIVPGFCGDLLGGSYVPVEMKEDKAEQLIKGGLHDYVFGRYFGRPAVEIPAQNEFLIKGKIKDLLEKTHVGDINEFISLNENFFTKHKVAKFVINAVRMYEFFGYEWRLPLWDDELIRYWYRVPNHLRIDGYLYNKYLLDILFKELTINYKKKASLAKNRFLLFFRKILPLEMVRGIKRLITMAVQEEDVNNFNALQRFVLNDLKDVKPIGINSIWAVWILKKFKVPFQD